MSIIFEGLITHVSEKNNSVRLSIVDKPTADKIRRFFGIKSYDDGDFRVPVDNDTYVITLNNGTMIVSKEGREHLGLLPKIIGWRVKGKMSPRKYRFKSTYSTNEGNMVEGVTLVAKHIDLGS